MNSTLSELTASYVALMQQKRANDEARINDYGTGLDEALKELAKTITELAKSINGPGSAP